MQEPTAIPSTAREALVIELIGDVGRVHDDIKAIPKLLKLSMADSITILADAVEEAEKTALILQETAKDAIRATTAKAAFDAGTELSSAIHQALERFFEPALQKAALQVNDLEKRVAKLSGSVRDRHATRINYIALAGFVLSGIVMVGGMTWVAVKSHDVNETNKWFYNEYKAQRAIIDELPPDLKKRFSK